MSGELFDRVCRVEVRKKAGQSVFFNGLRILFDVSKTEKECSAKITISNLASKTAAGFESGDFLTLTAGYKNANGITFSGEIIGVQTTRNATGRETVFDCRAGASGIHGKFLSVSFSAGHSALDALQDIANRSGMQVESRSLTNLPDKPYPAGFAFAGDYAAGLRQVAARLGAAAIVVDGVLYLQPANYGAPAADAPVLSADTGLLGYPVRTVEEKDKKKVYGWDLSALLFYGVRVGGFVMVKSKEIPGQFFRVKEIKHSGDTHGDKFGTALKVEDL